MADAYPDDEHVGLVPAAVGGADIALFEKGAPLSPNKGIIPDRFDGGYAWMLDLAKQAQKVGTIEGVLFHQGETNTADEQWKHTVAQILSDLRSDLEIGDVPFLAGELLYQNQGGCCGIHNEEINQLPDLIDNAHVVSAEGLGGADEAHFTAEAYREFGRRYAAEMRKHVDVGGGGHENATDPDGDGDYEDVNGNGELDSADVVEFFDRYDEPRFTDHVDAYDFNDSGRIDFDDVVRLFRENFGP